MGEALNPGYRRSLLWAMELIDKRLKEEHGHEETPVLLSQRQELISALLIAKDDKPPTEGE